MVFERKKWKIFAGLHPVPAGRATVGAGFFALFFSFFALALTAQPEGVALRHLTTDDGLSHNYVTAIAQDTQGFMWFGTMDGLTRFDGKRCTVFRPREGDSTSLPFRQVNGLSLDPLGRLWVTTTRGICRWDYVDSDTAPLPFSLDALITLGENVSYVTYPAKLSIQPGGYLHLLYDGLAFTVQDAYFSSVS